MAWIRRQQFDVAGLDALVGHHLAIIEARLRQRDLMDGAIERIAVSEPYAAAVRRLCCLRGIKSLSALTLLVEVGDLRRFAGAAACMGFTGPVPSEYSGERHRRGSITKTGTAHLRRVLVEAAWAYRQKPALGSAWRTRFADQPAELVGYAIAAQQRLHARYWRMTQRGHAVQHRHRRRRPRARGVHLGRDCGAKLRPGGSCPELPVPGRSRCRVHGGATPVGRDSPHFIHGRAPAPSLRALSAPARRCLRGSSR
ncbi:MAG TPA: hypothetical protein DCP25_18825 [Chloroflexi bacterium]|nr:hypothetical protein [Chloroflexota bacterium]